MSEGHSLSIAQARTFQPFRLLELPPELVDELDSPNPPTLQFKSTASESGAAEAALCTRTRTYRVREVQTSNSVFVAQAGTHEATHETADQDGTATVTNAGILTTIAKCSSYLELSDASTTSAASYLEAVLPVYDTGAGIQRALRNKQAVLHDVPLSETECQNAWIELAAFETDEPVVCFRPSKTALLDAWKEICFCATERSIDLSANLQAAELDELERSAQKVPIALITAVLKKLMTAESRLAIADTKFLDMDDIIEVTLDRSIVVKWVGSLHQATLPEHADILALWKDLLPEAWREDANFSLLDSNSTHQATQIHTNAVSRTQGAAHDGTKRKWHEKFKSARKR